MNEGKYDGKPEYDRYRLPSLALLDPATPDHDFCSAFSQNSSSFFSVSSAGLFVAGWGGTEYHGPAAGVL
jgi:hypothetical protein